MRASSRECRTFRRTISLMATLGLATGLLAVLAPSADAVVNTCKARNLTKDTPFVSNLQSVIKAASPGDTIAVKYVCVGHFKVGKRLVLVGRATSGMGKAVLDGNGTGRTLRVSARLSITNLKITGGAETSGYGGGGIYTTAAITLSDSLVTGNTTVSQGGGILTPDPDPLGDHRSSAAITLNGSSSVRGNTSPGLGGGIFTYGDVTLNDSSSVSGNTATQGGGIMALQFATVTLNDTSSVSGNDVVDVSGCCDGYGGGVSVGSSNTSLVLNGSSSVTGNTSTGWGGGISGYGSVTMNGSSSVSGNRANTDDDALGTGGGISLFCGTPMTGVVDGVNVNDNYLGNVGTTENNIQEFDCP